MGLASKRAGRIVLFPLIAVHYVRGLTSPPYFRSQCNWSAIPLVVKRADLFFLLLSFKDSEVKLSQLCVQRFFCKYYDFSLLRLVVKNRI